jgi:hypothetical protein
MQKLYTIIMEGNDNWEERLAVCRHQLECLRQGLDTDSLGNDLSGMTQESLEIEMAQIRAEIRREMGRNE